jgi:hypothetical protein
VTQVSPPCLARKNENWNSIRNPKDHQAMDDGIHAVHQSSGIIISISHVFNNDNTTPATVCNER